MLAMKKEKPRSRNAGYQAKHRAKRAAERRAFEQLLAAHPVLRKEADATAVNLLRKTPTDHHGTDDDPIDDAITKLRKRGDQLAADYVALLSAPGLTHPETRAVHAHFIRWRELFDDSVAKSRCRAPDGPTPAPKVVKIRRRR
jgi:hypothetical protein